MTRPDQDAELCQVCGGEGVVAGPRMCVDCEGAGIVPAAG